MSSRNGILLALAVCVGSALPFLNQAVYIDADMLVHTAGQILVNPVDPPLGQYGVHMANISHTRMPEESVYYRTGHPPLLPYLLAPVIAVFGKSEWALHLAMLPFHLLTVLGMWRLLGFHFDRRDRLFGTLLWATSPVLMVNSHALMWDVPVTACTVWALAFFVGWLRTGHRSTLLASGLVAGLGALVKTNIFPVYLACGAVLLIRRDLKNLLLWSSPAIALPSIWVVHNLVVFGQIQYLSSGWLNLEAGNIRYRGERLLAYFGGIFLLPPFWYWLMLHRPHLRWTYLLYPAASFGWGILLFVFLDKPWWFAIVYGFLTWPGIWVAGRLLSWLFSNAPKNIPSVEFKFLGLFGGLYLVLLFCMPSANCRYLLPLVPTMAYLVLLQLAEWPAGRQKRFRIAVLAVALPFSLALSAADYLQAEANRRLPLELTSRGYTPNSTWYLGRTGYDYYLHRAGFLNFWEGPRTIAPGDYVVEEWHPSDFDMHEQMPTGWSLDPLDSLELFWFPLRTMGIYAGFYGHDRLPYALDFSNPLKRIAVYRAKRPVR